MTIDTHLFDDEEDLFDDTETTFDDEEDIIVDGAGTRIVAPTFIRRKLANGNAL